MGYDIYDENSNFYFDQCSTAAINGNDIILSDRKKDFFPSEVSLCNDSCTYSQIDFESKRFTCDCDMNYDFKKPKRKEKKEEKEDDTSYLNYFLSLINYKIIKCYKLFLEYKSYYYNAGFYIAVGNLLFSFLQILIFVKCGIKTMDLNILQNVPNIEKLKKLLKEQIKRRKESIKEININNPPKNNKEKSKRKSRKTVLLKGNDISIIKEN